MTLTIMSANGPLKYHSGPFVDSPGTSNEAIYYIMVEDDGTEQRYWQDEIWYVPR